MADYIARLDAQLDQLLAGWNIYTTLVALVLVTFVVYPIFFSQEPDTHPLLLSRQANVSPIRQPGESATHRSLETPIGYPLKAGLDIKEQGASRWSSGKNGDMRDIWRRAVRGPQNENGESTSPTGKILTVYGSEEVEAHDLNAVSRDINNIGSYIKEQGGNHVAIYLPNSIELLVVIFAATFYGFTPILIPYNQSQDVIVRLLHMANADFLIASAGTIPYADLKQESQKVRHILWVVEKSSRHMDWKQSSRNVSMWHQIVELRSQIVSSDLPANSEGEELPNIITIWQNEPKTSGELVALTQKNIVAAVAAQISALPPKHRITASDLFLPADSLTTPYILIQTLAALFCNASIAINSVAGQDVDLPLVARGLAPTIIAASAGTALKLHAASKRSLVGALKKLAHRAQLQALQAGRLPSSRGLSSLNPPIRAAIGTAPSRLRFLYIFERTPSNTPPLSLADLSDLRAFTGARVIYVLTAAKVAGAVAQMNIYDYRIESGGSGRRSHFGVPVSCIEVKLVDTEQCKTTEDTSSGEIVVSGPAVLGGRVNLGVLGTFRDDGTLTYI